jgi:hypothetical protein
VTGKVNGATGSRSKGVAEDSRSGTPGRSAPFERREMPSRRKEPPGASVFGFFGGRERKGGRGTKREETASKVRRKKTWKVQNLRRARSPFLPEKGGRAGGCRWVRERKPLERRRQAVRFDGKAHERIAPGNRGGAAGPEKSPEGGSP